MKRLLLGLSLAIGLALVAPPTTADAMSKDWWADWGAKRQRNKPDKPRHVVPEFDPGAAGSALVLLLGGTALLVSRRRKGKAA